MTRTNSAGGKPLPKSGGSKRPAKNVGGTRESHSKAKKSVVNSKTVRK